jgi:16S rRNA processing protein RimM
LSPAPPSPRRAAGKPGESLSAGRVGRAHGLDGSFYVTRPVARLLEPGATLTLDGEERQIERRAGTDARPIVRLAGIASREQAEQLRGLELTVARTDAPALQEGEYWAHELEGCEVLDGEVAVGTVTRLVELPSCEALEVARADGGPALLVPMVRDAIREIDVAARRVQVDLAFVGAEIDSRQGTTPPSGHEPGRGRS